MTADEIYERLREAADRCGFVSNEADLVLQQAADAIAGDPRNVQDDLAVVDDTTEAARTELFLDACDKDD